MQMALSAGGAQKASLPALRPLAIDTAFEVIGSGHALRRVMSLFAIFEVGIFIEVNNFHLRNEKRFFTLCGFSKIKVVPP